MARKTSAHAELDRLRQETSQEHAKHRGLATQPAAAERELEEARRAVVEAYSQEDGRAVTASRKREEAALAKVEDIGR